MNDKQLNNFFSIKDVNKKWEILIEMYYDMNNTLEPARLVKAKDDQEPFFNPISKRGGGADSAPFLVFCSLWQKTPVWLIFFKH